MSDKEDNKILKMDLYSEGFKEISNMVNQFDRLLVLTKSNLNEKRKNDLEEQWHDLRPNQNQIDFEKKRILAQLRGGVL